MQEVDDFEELDDTDEPVDRRGENSANSSMESRSFEEEGVESFQYNKHSGAVDVHRSNNQEDEQDTRSRGDKSGSDIGEEDFEEEDFEEEDHGTQPNFVTRNRPAFLSPDNPPAKQQFDQNEDSNPSEKDEGEEEYADDAFDEDEEAEEDHEMKSSSAKPASPPQPAFVPSSRPGAGYRPSFSSSHDNAEEEDMESVEEEIEDEEDMMSVGAVRFLLLSTTNSTHIIAYQILLVFFCRIPTKVVEMGTFAMLLKRKLLLDSSDKMISWG